MIDKAQSFENMIVWQKSIDLAVDIYKITKLFPKSEQFALTNQIKRAATSISANIAEGFGRQSAKEKLQFYAIAYGSLLEVKNFLYLAERLQYLNSDQKDELMEKIIVLQKQLNSLRGSIKNNAA